MNRALVIKTYGDPEFAGAIVEGMTKRVIPLDDDELAAVKAELAEIKAAKAKQDARDGVRESADEKRWKLIKADMADEYTVKTPGRVKAALLIGWACLWVGLMGWVEYFRAWNRG